MGMNHQNWGLTRDWPQTWWFRIEAVWFWTSELSNTCSQSSNMDPESTTQKMWRSYQTGNSTIKHGEFANIFFSWLQKHRSACRQLQKTYFAPVTSYHADSVGCIGVGIDSFYPTSQWRRLRVGVRYMIQHTTHMGMYKMGIPWSAQGDLLFSTRFQWSRNGESSLAASVRSFAK